jgi:hypothetical protein
MKKKDGPFDSTDNLLSTMLISQARANQFYSWEIVLEGREAIFIRSLKSQFPTSFRVSQAMWREHREMAK